MVDVGARKLLHQSSGGWSLVEQPMTASPGSFSVAVLTLVVVTKQFQQKAASISETTSRRRIPRRMLRKSITMPNLGTPSCEFNVFFWRIRPWSMSFVVHLFILGKFEPREYAVRRSDGGHGSCWKRSWAWADLHQTREGR